MAGSCTHDEVAKLQAEVDDLRGRLEILTSELSSDDLASGENDDPDARTGRRQMFKVAGAAALGAVGASLLKSAPADATTGTMSFGASNDAGTAETDLTSSNSNTSLQVTNTGSSGDAIDAVINGTSNNGACLTATNSSAGSAIQAYVNNVDNPSASIYAVTNGAGPAVQAIGEVGYGVSAQGVLAPIRLVPSGSAGAPSSGTHALGEMYVDSAGIFYKCVVAGTPGTWVALYSVIPLAAPVRVISTPSGGGNTGGLTGPFAADGTTHTTSVLTGGGTGIPAIAVGVVGNLAISGNGSPLNGDGYLTLWPAGPTNPGTASILAAGDCFGISTGVTVAFGTGGNAGKLSFSWQGGGSPLPCQVFLDVTAFIL